MNNATLLLLLLSAMMQNASAKRQAKRRKLNSQSIQWNKMKEIYRMLPKMFSFDDRLMEKILKIKPSRYFLLSTVAGQSNKV